MQDTATDGISKQPAIAELDVLSLLKETEKAIGQLKSNKAAGVDSMQPEAWINGGHELHTKLHELLSSCWEQGAVPEDFCDAVIITLYRNKGDKSYCSNICEITLLSIASKHLASHTIEQTGSCHCRKISLRETSVASDLTNAPVTWYLP